MKNRINSLQVVRAFAFLGIFASHSNITIFSPGGAWGVSVFLILSGFLMIYSYYDTDRIDSDGVIYSIKFGINKIKKLYPLHIVTMLLAMPYLIIDCLEHSGMNSVLDSVIKTVTNTFLIQSWFPSIDIYFSLNAVSWYLSVSLFLYIMFPFILSRIREYKGIKTAIIVIIITYVIQLVMSFCSYLIQINIIHNDRFIHWFAYIFPLSRLEDFVIGCNLGYVFIKVKKDNGISDRRYTWMEFGIIAVIAIQMIAYVLFVSIPAKTEPSVSAENWWGVASMWTLSSCALVFLFAFNKGNISRILTNKALLFIGNLSANAFLIHQIVYRYLNTFERKLLGDTFMWINLFACLIITIVCSYAWEALSNYYKNTKRVSSN